MALHAYVKEQKVSIARRSIHAFSYISLTVGALLMFWAYYPIISFQIYSKLFIAQSVTTPIPQSQIASSISRAEAVLGPSNTYSSNLRDFVQANVWFPSRQNNLISRKITLKGYTLSIPKLNIVNAKVSIGSNDLSKHLVDYMTQSLPGEYGNNSIFGHSSLPQLYNVKDYKTIFTYLPSLERGDKVFATVEGKEYEYEVYDMFVVKPDEVSVLEQRLDASYLTLITCVPPGTYNERLVVRAKLKKTQIN